LKLELVKDISIHISKYKVLKLTELTSLGKHHLRMAGRPAAYDIESKGGLEHAFWVHLIKKTLLTKGYGVKVEDRGVDIVATKDKGETAIEVETGNSYPTKNILKCIQLGFPKIISVATNAEALTIIKRFVTHYNLNERVTLVLARDLLDEQNSIL